jgi:hypothetical protein
MVRSKFMKIFFAIVITQCCLQLVTSFDECDASINLEKKSKEIPIEMFSKSKSDFNDRPRPDQKSLLIVFDTTGSMNNDLTQLRDGAQDIVNTYSAKTNNPIYNYVLSLFNDPSKNLQTFFLFCLIFDVSSFYKSITL